MKKKLKQALVTYFITDYNKRINRHYKQTKMSKMEFLNMMSKAERVSICQHNYCCYGMFKMCWFDEYAKGIWYMTDDEVKEMAIDIFESYVDEFNEDGRIAICEDECGVHILLLARDLKEHKMDTFIDFWN